jgi:hypothetical protein
LSQTGPPAEQLNRLAEPHKVGALSTAEFEWQRAEILGR